MTYIRYVMSKDQKETEAEPIAEPNIFGPKLTNEQKDELLDAYYWVHMKHDVRHKTILFYYKLYGWYVRAKDGYRTTKSYDMRQLNVKRRKLIENGAVHVQTKLTFDTNKLKSTRGRKPKKNV